MNFKKGDYAVWFSSAGYHVARKRIPVQVERDSDPDRARVLIRVLSENRTTWVNKEYLETLDRHNDMRGEFEDVVTDSGDFDLEVRE